MECRMRPLRGRIRGPERRPRGAWDPASPANGSGLDQPPTDKEDRSGCGAAPHIRVGKGSAVPGSRCEAKRRPRPQVSRSRRDSLPARLDDLPRHFRIIREDSGRPSALRPGVAVEGNLLGEALSVFKLAYLVDDNVFEGA